MDLWCISIRRMMSDWSVWKKHCSSSREEPERMRCQSWEGRPGALLKAKGLRGWGPAVSVVVGMNDKGVFWVTAMCQILGSGGSPWTRQTHGAYSVGPQWSGGGGTVKCLCVLQLEWLGGNDLMQFVVGAKSFNVSNTKLALGNTGLKLRSEVLTLSEGLVRFVSIIILNCMLTSVRTFDCK